MMVVLIEIKIIIIGKCFFLLFAKIMQTCQSVTKLTFLKVMMLIRQAHQKRAQFFIIGIFLDNGVSFESMCTMRVMIYQKCL